MKDRSNRYFLMEFQTLKLYKKGRKGKQKVNREHNKKTNNERVDINPATSVIY